MEHTIYFKEGVVMQVQTLFIKSFIKSVESSQGYMIIYFFPIF